MATPSPAAGWECQLGYSGTNSAFSTATFTAFANVKRINGPGISVSPIPYQDFDSASRVIQKLPGFQDNGEVSFDGNFLGSAHHAAVVASAAVEQYYHSVWKERADVPPSPVSSSVQKSWSFPGFISGITPTADEEDVPQATVTVTVSGEMAFA